MAKASEKIARWRAERPGVPWFSLEFFPPRTPLGVAGLHDRLDRLAALEPLWVDITWGPGGSTADATLELCASALRYHGLDVMMHLTCTNTDRGNIHDTLTKCKELGIVNILACRGDAAREADGGDKGEDGRLIHAIDLVKYMKGNFGDHFCIAVAGYPEGHPEAASKEKDLENLREKVNAGADLIVTQHFYDNAEFFEYADKVKAAGIAVPLVAGIMPIQSYANLLRMQTALKMKVPSSVWKALELVKEDDQKVQDTGVELATRMCRELRERGVAGFHFYTMNIGISTTRILRELGLAGDGARRPRPPLPWRRSAEPARCSRERVRPIYWAQRPRSYLLRTAAWRDFPPAEAFADFVLTEAERQLAAERAPWDEPPMSAEAVAAVFADRLRGRTRTLPWSQEPPGEAGPAALAQLVALCLQGLLVTHWQPRANGVPSTDVALGWGSADGFVYQKAYLEFFASPDTVKKLVAGLATEKLISFIAANRANDVMTNVDEISVNAVAWGVFPGMQVQQPTVADYQSFMAWKDEAFELWSELVEACDKASSSRECLTSIQANWYLVSVVDDNFLAGDLHETLFRALGL